MPSWSQRTRVSLLRTAARRRHRCYCFTPTSPSPPPPPRWACHMVHGDGGRRRWVGTVLTRLVHALDDPPGAGGWAPPTLTAALHHQSTVRAWATGVGPAPLTVGAHRSVPRGGWAPAWKWLGGPPPFAAISWLLLRHAATQPHRSVYTFF